MATSAVSICNLALAQIPAEAIASLTENSLGARECSRVYAQCLQELLEYHEWDFGGRRVALAAVANDRPGEWLYAYAPPSDMATPRRLLPSLVAETGVYTPLAGQSLAPFYNPYSTDPFTIDYEISDAVLYTNLADAVLDYSLASVNESVMPALFINAMAMEIAARVVMPALKSRDRQGDLIKASETAKQRAMAADLNRKPQRQWSGPSEAQLARGC